MYFDAEDEDGDLEIFDENDFSLSSRSKKSVPDKEFLWYFR
jgi:hypothetical protein